MPARVMRSPVRREWCISGRLYKKLFMHFPLMIRDIKKHEIHTGWFFNWSALKMTKCQITCKSLQKSSKCQNFLRVWHLVIFRADQLKKPPCINILTYALCQVNLYLDLKHSFLQLF